MHTYPDNLAERKALRGVLGPEWIHGKAGDEEFARNLLPWTEEEPDTFKGAMTARYPLLMFDACSNSQLKLSYMIAVAGVMLV